ncbi:MAG: co-chaperone GroES [Chloroflexota bacterium]
MYSMTKQLKPLGDRLVVKPQEQEETTASGLVLPETAKEKPQQGVVLAIGPGRRDDDGKRIEMDVAVDDVVLYAKYAGTEIKLEGEKLLILKESDVLAVLEE